MVKPEIIDKPEEIKRIDRSGMLGIAETLPEQLADASQRAAAFSLPKLKNISRIIVLGMGGSAISGDIIRALAKLNVLVNRHYILPDSVDKQTLVLALSYSGNTEETLAAAKETIGRPAPMIAVSSGGQLKELAEKNNFPCLMIPAGFQPRAALAYLLVTALVALEKSGLLAVSQDIEEAIPLLKRLKSAYSQAVPARTNPVKQLAKKLVDKIPVILATAGTTEAAGLRLKTQLNENSKLTALFNVFPELNHNEIVNLAALKKGGHNFGLIILRDDKDLERVKKRIEITKSLIGGQLGGANEIVSQGKSLLARLLSLIYFGDLLTVYLALLRGIDPTPVEVIERLKKELQR